MKNIVREDLNMCYSNFNNNGILFIKTPVHYFNAENKEKNIEKILANAYYLVTISNFIYNVVFPNEINIAKKAFYSLIYVYIQKNSDDPKTYYNQNEHTFQIN
jgi:hypothetical protein